MAYHKARYTNWDKLKTYFGLCDLEDMLDWEASSDSDISQSGAEESFEDQAEL